jgi:hypothetical protein
VVQVATPLTSVLGEGHSGIGCCPPPLGLYVKVTVPVGYNGPGLLAVTVAVKVTAWLTFDPFGSDEASAILLLILLTACVNVPLLGLKLPSLLYVALTTSEGAGSDCVVQVATPLLLRAIGLGHSGIAMPLLYVKVTVPVGDKPPGLLAVTVAVKVTAWLTFDPFGSDDASAVLLLALLTVCVNVPLLGLKLVSPL